MKKLILLCLLFVCFVFVQSAPAVDPDYHALLKKRLEMAHQIREHIAAKFKAGTADTKEFCAADLALAEAEYELTKFEKEARAAMRGPDRSCGLTFQGKTFEDWKWELQTELDPKCRTEAIRAMAAFGAHGRGQEVMKIIAGMAKRYNFSTIDGSDFGKLKQAAIDAICLQEPAIPQEDSLPTLLRLLEEGNDSEFSFAAWTLSRLGKISEKDAVEKIYACMWSKNFDKRNADQKKWLFQVLCRCADTDTVLKFLSESIKQNDEERFGLMFTDLRQIPPNSWQVQLDYYANNPVALENAFGLPFHISGIVDEKMRTRTVR